MAERIRDAWLWLGFGVFLLGASKGVAYGLNYMSTLARDEQSSQEDCTVSTTPEDLISLEALSVLIGSPNGEISKAATKLCLSRFLSSPHNRQAWLDDFFSNSEKVRRGAEQLDRLCREVSYPDDEHTREVRHAFHDLITVSILSDSPMARTIRAAYHIAREIKDKGSEVPLQLLRDWSFARCLRHSKTVFLCPNMKQSQFLPWISAMSADAISAEGCCDDNLRITAMIEHFLAQTRKAETMKDGTDDLSWLSEAATLLRADPINIMRAEARGGDRTRLHVPWLLNENYSRMAPRTARFVEESPEETEVRRRDELRRQRRHAMVWSVDD